MELTTLQSAELQKVAVGIDIRSGQSFDELHGVLDHMKDNGVEYEILFLDAEDSVLVKRYKETRRNHPLAGGERVDKGAFDERVKSGVGQNIYTESGLQESVYYDFVIWI